MRNGIFTNIREGDEHAVIKFDEVVSRIVILLELFDQHCNKHNIGAAFESEYCTNCILVKDMS